MADTALAAKTQTFRGLLDKMKSQLAMALPRHITPDRMNRIVMTYMQQNPALFDCTIESVLRCVVELSQLGLEVGPTGGAHLIPFKRTCTLVIDYKGKVDLARRSALIKTIYAEAVYEKDEFSYSLGLNPTLVHIPSDEKDRGRITHAYAVVKFTNGGDQFKVVNASDIERAKSVSKSASYPDSPWKKYEDAMWCKTAVHRLSPFLPRSPEIIRAERLEYAEAEGEAPMIDVEFEVPGGDKSVSELTAAGTTQAKTDEIKDKLGAKPRTQKPAEEKKPDPDPKEDAKSSVEMMGEADGILKKLWPSSLLMRNKASKLLFGQDSTALDKASAAELSAGLSTLAQYIEAIGDGKPAITPAELEKQLESL